MGERAPPLHSRWVGLILLPGLTVWFLFCLTAEVPPSNKGSPRFNAGCVLQARLLEAGPELHYVALPADTYQRELPRLDDAGVLALIHPGISPPGFHHCIHSTIFTASTLSATSFCPRHSHLTHRSVAFSVSIWSSVPAAPGLGMLQPPPQPSVQFLPLTSGGGAPQLHGSGDGVGNW